MLNTNERVIKHKVGLLDLAEELGDVSKACQVMGYRGIRSIVTRPRSRKAALNR